MASKNTGILTWRAPDISEPKNEPVPKLAPPPPAPAAIAEPHKEILHTLLRPSAKQKTTLDSMFAGPIFLRELLAKTSEKPKTLEDAGLFLLHHHRELQPHIYGANRSKAVDLLKQLIVAWSAYPPELVELAFPQDCSVSESNQIFFPIPRLGTIPVKDEVELGAYRRSGQYSSSFVLIHSPFGYVAEIQFSCRKQVIIQRPVRTLQSPKHSPKAKAALFRKEQKEHAAQVSRLKFEQYLMMFDDAVDACLMDEMRISKKFVTTNFSALEGYEVLGGLPSLGKHR